GPTRRHDGARGGRRRSGGAAGGGRRRTGTSVRGTATVAGGDLPGDGRVTAVWLVTWREVLTRARRRSFQIGLAVSVLLVAAVGALPTFFDDPSYRLALVGPESAELRPAITALAEAE